MCQFLAWLVLMGVIVTIRNCHALKNLLPYTKLLQSRTYTLLIINWKWTRTLCTPASELLGLKLAKTLPVSMTISWEKQLCDQLWIEKLKSLWCAALSEEEEPEDSFSGVLPVGRGSSMTTRPTTWSAGFGL